MPFGFRVRADVRDIKQTGRGHNNADLPLYNDMSWLDGRQGAPCNNAGALAEFELYEQTF